VVKRLPAEQVPETVPVSLADQRPGHGAAPPPCAGSVALEARRVTKRFGGVQALDSAQLSVAAAEIHAVLGENGAGKSTLVKIVAGVIQADEGEILVGGKHLDAMSPRDSAAAGIAVVHQELSLIPELSVAHNLLLTRMPKRARVISMAKANRLAEEALTRLGLGHIDPRAAVTSLPLDQKQMVEVAKATLVQPRILILDEATSSLGGAEVERLFNLVRHLRALGTTVVVITHRMSEVWAVADAMTILRDGRTVGRFEVGAISQHEAVALMAGRDVKTIFPEKHPRSVTLPALELRGVRLRADRLPWSLDLYKGEILGLGGLEGQGQRELLAWLFGIGKGVGTVVLNGQPVKLRHPSVALQHGIVLIPEDRKAEGLHLDLPVRWNLAMATLRERARFGLMDLRAERHFAAKVVQDLRIKLDSLFQPASALSGGTQQKVVIGKFIARKPSILLFLDPTRGIDVQTKFNFYEMIRAMADAGAACLLYSSDTEELVGLCDRVAVFVDGVPVRVFEGGEVSLDAVVAASFAVTGPSS
jgi:ribose transport system ATP-binding protein